MKENSIYIKQSSVSWRNIENTVVILNPAQGNVHELNSTASLLWNKLDGKNSVSDLSDQLIEIYNLDQKEAQIDLFDFLKSALESNLIKEIAYEK